MIIDSRNQQPAVNVYPNGGYYGGGNGGFGADGANGAWFWIIILFFFAIFGGWGNNGNNGNGNWNGVQFVPYGFGGYGAGNEVRQGFDQAAIMSGLNGISSTLTNGFSNAEVSRCNQQANILATMNNNQNVNTAAMNNLAMGLQNCCCENRAATADLKFTVANEACADRAAVGDAFQGLTAQNNANMNALMNQFNAGIQSIKDQMCNDKIDQKNEKIADLERQLTMANLAASQNAQTSTIQAGQRALANEVEQYVNPTAIPAYIVQNPNCCSQNYYGCRKCG